MDCAERRRLVELYSEAQAELSKLVTELYRAATHAQEHDTFEEAWAACESQRRLFNQIGEQMHDHLRQHRCMQPGTPEQEPR